MDNFFVKMFRRETPGTIATTAPTPSAPKGGSWQAKVVMPRGNRSLLVPAWCRGVSLIMQTMGQMLVQSQLRNPVGGNYVEDISPAGRRLNYLLQVRPNPLMTASEMQEQIEYHKLYFGNAYVYIDREYNGEVAALWLCTNGSYNPLANTYALTYNTPYGPRIMAEAPAADVLHFKNLFLTGDMYVGLPMIECAIRALSISATGDEQALQDVAKGGKQKILLQEDKGQAPGLRGRVSKQELRKVRDEFDEMWNATDFVVFDNEVKATVISQTAQQLQLLETRGYQVAEIARILGIPRIMMMETEGSSYKMPEHATQEFLLRTIQPRIRKHEDELNSKLLRDYDFGMRRIHVCELALRRLDAKGQADIDKIHLETGWSPNEIRAQYDLPAIPEGNDHYVSTNLAVAGSEKLKSNGTATEGNGEG